MCVDLLEVKQSTSADDAPGLFRDDDKFQRGTRRLQLGYSRKPSFGIRHCLPGRVAEKPDDFFVSVDREQARKIRLRNWTHAYAGGFNQPRSNERHEGGRAEVL